MRSSSIPRIGKRASGPPWPKWLSRISKRVDTQPERCGSMRRIQTLGPSTSTADGETTRCTDPMTGGCTPATASASATTGSGFPRSAEVPFPPLTA